MSVKNYIFECVLQRHTYVTIKHLVRKELTNFGYILRMLTGRILPTIRFQRRENSII